MMMIMIKLWLIVYNKTRWLIACVTISNVGNEDKMS